jgi:hypothetical protein
MTAPQKAKPRVKRGSSQRTLSSAASTSLHQPMPSFGEFASYPQGQYGGDGGLAAHKQSQRPGHIDDSFPSIGVRSRGVPPWESSGIDPHDVSGCSHSSRRLGCAACAIGASVSGFAEGHPTKQLSPMSAWKSQLHGPVAPPVKANSFRKPKSASSSPVLSDSFRRLAEDSADDAASTGIVGIEVLEHDNEGPLPSNPQLPSSFLQWSIHARR